MKTSSFQVVGVASPGRGGGPEEPDATTMLYGRAIRLTSREKSYPVVSLSRDSEHQSHDREHGSTRSKQRGGGSSPFGRATLLCSRKMGSRGFATGGIESLQRQWCGAKAG